MTLWEELADKTRNGAQKVCEFTLDAVDKAKLKARVTVLRNKVTGLYTRIGRIVYEERNCDLKEEKRILIDNIMSEIESLKEEISACEETLFDMR